MNANQFYSWLNQYSTLFTNQTYQAPLIMGVLNVTADSFSDGGSYLATDKACAHAMAMIAQGADIIDIGGESSRPGALPVAVDEELERVIPVIEGIRQQSDVCISIDTYKPEVMQAAIHAGANLINDIYALQYAGALEMAVRLDVPVCLMHMQGNPLTMQDHPYYKESVLAEIQTFFSERIHTCQAAGISKNNILLDPGFGFGKHLAHNMTIMRQLDSFSSYNMPILLGVSRKSTIGAILNKAVHERLIGGIALAVYAATKGVALVRTHDVDETRQAFTIIDAINNKVE